MEQQNTFAELSPELNATVDKIIADCMRDS
jgi:hypothetical protein